EDGLAEYTAKFAHGLLVTDCGPFLIRNDVVVACMPDVTRIEELQEDIHVVAFREWRVLAAVGAVDAEAEPLQAPGNDVHVGGEADAVVIRQEVRDHGPSPTPAS